MSERTAGQRMTEEIKESKERDAAEAKGFVEMMKAEQESRA
jgi:hypothetical protein